ncbi:hypothetical protein [Streptomyces sp. SAS_276]|uniref:hypothetical protein n=1 Tax=Streptomyces sp. SAS_276 TaxID=3412745 RepID=UPI00403C5657
MNTSRSKGSSRWAAASAGHTWRGAAPAMLLTAGALTAATPQAQGQARAPGPRRRRRIPPTEAGYVVRVKVPLPPSFGVRPAACDRLSYPRYRSTDGPNAPPVMSAYQGSARSGCSVRHWRSP